MNRGSLVVTKNRWSLCSLSLGIIIEKIGNTTADEIWVVMWSGKESPSFQAHIEDSLVEISERNMEEIGQRGCISM